MTEYKYNTKQGADLIGTVSRTIRRYVEQKKLPFKLSGKTKMFKKTDLLKVASELQENKEKHRPDTESNPKNLDLPSIEIVTDKDLVIKAMKANPLKMLLNDTGKSVLILTTKYLKKTGLLSSCSKDSIMRYAISVQMLEKYQITAEIVEAKYFHDLVKQYGADVKHYEKELGLTPASLSKIKPPEKEDKGTIDPMDALLNGK